MILTTILHPNGIIFVEEATYMIALDVLKQFSGMKIVTGSFTNIVSDGPCTNVFFIKKSILIRRCGNNLSRSRPFRLYIITVTSVGWASLGKQVGVNCQSSVRRLPTFCCLLVCLYQTNFMCYWHFLCKMNTRWGVHVSLHALHLTDHKHFILFFSILVLLLPHTPIPPPSIL